MVQTVEAQAFLTRIASLPKGPGIDLDEVLKPSLDDETELRRLLATDRSNDRLSNPYVGLVDVFDAPSDIKITRARVVKDDQDLNAKYVMPLPEDKRRKEGEPCMVSDMDEFKRNWNIFSEGSLSQLTDWRNVIASGGSVLACLTPLSDENKASKRAIRKFYHSTAYPTSDVDLFLWGLTPEEAEKKIVTIYEAVRDSVPWDVTCVRTKNAISIHSQYPYRSVQIVLRLYHSPAEVLAGFDIDAPCCAYDGTRVWANPRAIVAMMRQCNTTDITRRSPSYELRLSKYAKRGFEVYVPNLSRIDVDPTIFERSIVRVEGLARLLVLESLATYDERQAFLRSRRELRGRPAGPWRYARMRGKYKQDLKSSGDLEEFEMSNYDVGSLHIPYGPAWDARRIDKLIYQTDLGMNSTFNPKNKGRRLHRHFAFFGTIEECIEDCCEFCPDPIDDAERELQTKEEEVYMRGRVTFMQENPGRQIITGSFNPIDEGEWSTQVYIGPTERLFAAIAAHDRAAVARMIQDDVNVNRRDHVGRSSLHFAVMCNATEIACDLVDAGARMTARLVDGRTSLHLAIQRDQATVVRKLLEKSAQNQEASNTGTTEEPEDDKEKNVTEGPSSEDDWSSEDDGVMEIDDEEADDEGDMDDMDEDEQAKKEPSKGKINENQEASDGDEIPDDNTDEPDVFDLNAADWDFGLTPLGYAVIFASVPILEDLIAAGVDVKASTENTTLNVHPLTLTMLRPDEDEACTIAERLILRGATSSPADGPFRTIFYRIVSSKKVKLASTILRCDPNASVVINSPRIAWNDIMFPLDLSLHERDYSMTAALLAYGARLKPLEEDITRTIATRPAKETRHLLIYSQGNDLLSRGYHPVETALVRHDDIVRLLISLGAEFNVGIRAVYNRYTREEDKRSILDWVNVAIKDMKAEMKRAQKQKEVKPMDFTKSTNWKEYATFAITIANSVMLSYQRLKDGRMPDVERMERTKEYFEEVKELLVSTGAKTWPELASVEKPRSSAVAIVVPLSNLDQPDSTKERSFEDYDFAALSSRSYYSNLPRHLIPRYHELCEACLNGDNEKVQALCLPPEESQSGETPLQISVMVRDPTGNQNTGLTPFAVAVERRKWDTARLILAIAVAQYQADEEEVVFSVDDMDIDGDESDNESDCSDDSDATVEQSKKENPYVDVAKRPSTIKCDAKPGLFFSTPCQYGHVVDGRYLAETVFDKAVRENDLEAFVKLLNMFTTLPIPENVPTNFVQPLLLNDRPDMLDEFIRHTGTGIDLKTVRHEAKDAIPMNDQNKLYLGLNVHGKKRADLARKNDPNAGLETQESPLLWRALRANAEKVVDYLSSDRVYSAYRSYAVSHSDERAERLRSISNLKELLPQWLGFRTNSWGESPLTAAVLSGKARLLKNVFAKHKTMMKAALHDKYTPANLNILQIAVRSSNEETDTELLDILLARNVSPLETDTINQNIYHILSLRVRYRLLEHLLGKLPADVNDVLLKQQTCETFKTPLHVAVASCNMKTVELLLARSHAANTIRDSDGSLPLHIAIRSGLSRIVKMLIDASPSTLFVEDGVGCTAFESATLLLFRQRMNQFSSDNYSFQFTCANPTSADRNPERFDLAHLEKELPRLRHTIDSLLELGKLRKDTKLEKELVGFVERMEGHMRRLQGAPVVVAPEEDRTGDVQDYQATYDVIKEALNRVQGERQLVHLIDVQKSVDGSLKRSYRPKKIIAEDDMQKEEKETEKSFVAEHAFIDVPNLSM